MRDATALHDAGYALQVQGRLEEAVAQYKKAIGLVPDFVSAYYNLGNSLASLGRYDEAVASYEKAGTLKRDSPEIFSNLGVVLAALGRHEQACARFKQALGINPAFPNAHYALATSLVALQRPVDAIPHYEKAVALAPGHATACHSLAMIFSSLKRYDEAAKWYQKTIKIAPDSAEAHNDYATVLQALKRHDEAIVHYRKAISLKPALAPAYFNLAHALVEIGRDEEAVAQYDAALAHKPDYPQALCNRGDALARLNRNTEAVASYDGAIALKPDYLEAYNNAGNVLLTQRRHDAAAKYLQQALVLDPACAEAHSNLGIALQALGRNGDALAHYDRSIELKPDYAGVYTNKGSVLIEYGRLDEARQSLEKAVELDPKNTTAYHLLAEIKRFAPGDQHLVAMENTVKDASLTADQRVDLHFALGKAFADTAQYDMSSQHFLAANTLKRHGIEYDEESTLEMMTLLQSMFTREMIDSKRGLGNPSAAPIFIIGMPRSGTTLIEQILGSHREVYAAGELTAFPKSMSAVPNLEEALDNVDPSVSAKALSDLGGRYIEKIAAIAHGRAHVTDKMPVNFRLLGFIHLAFPNARIIHVRRDPLDTCLSCFTKLFTYDQPFCYDLAELGRYYRAYDGLMKHWRRVLPESTLLEVNYEDVVDDLETQARRIVAHCGLSWDDACLEFHRTERPVRTASATQVRQPIYKTSIGRWHAYRDAIGPLLNALGPELAGDAAAR